MALKDFVKEATDSVSRAANEAVKKTTDGFKGADVLQGALGNYSSYSPEQAYEEYGAYLMKDEGIKRAFKLVRDVMIFTDKRILFVDKTGITGSKAKIQSINYFSIVSVELLTASFRFDDADLYFTYITTPNIKSLNTEYCTKHLEFPRKFPVQEIYSELQELAYNNCMRLHDIDMKV